MDGVDPAGGSEQLAKLLDEHGEIVVADLLRYYGMDLRELFSEVPPWTPRYVLVMINQLPMESATVAAGRGSLMFTGWDESRYMQASIINALRGIQYTLVLANSDPKKGKPKAPEPYPIPDTRIRSKEPKPLKPGSFAFIAARQLAQAREKKKAGS